MSRSLSDAFKAAAFAQETGEVVAALLTITHEDLEVPLRISSDPTQRVEGGPNFIANPGVFSSGWAATMLPVTPDAVAGPLQLGGMASAAIPAATFGQHVLTRAFTGVSGNQALRFELICKVKSGDFGVILRIGSGANNVLASFDLDSGTVNGSAVNSGAGTGAFAEVVDLGDGWRLCRLEGTPNQGATASLALWVTNAAGLVSYTGNGVDGVYLYRAVLQVPFAGTADVLYGTYSRGQTYFFIPFRLQLPAEQDDAPPAAQVVLDNVGRELIDLLRSTVTPAQVQIEVVLASDPDTVEISFPLLDLADTNYDAGQVTLDLVIDYLVNEPFPAESFDPSGFPALFG